MFKTGCGWASCPCMRANATEKPVVARLELQTDSADRGGWVNLTVGDYTFYGPDLGRKKADEIYAQMSKILHASGLVVVEEK